MQLPLTQAWTKLRPLDERDGFKKEQGTLIEWEG
jgi:hypothetical protein